MTEKLFAPTVHLSNGCDMPAIGIGTFGSDKYSAPQIAEAVYGAVKAGYRLIDCAEVYGNEREIGVSLKRLFDEGVVGRGELFIASKVWNDHHAPEAVRKACLDSLDALGLEYLDAYYIHWPFPNYHAPGCDGDARNPDSRPFSKEEFLSVYRACEELYREGKIRAIGVSNMTVSKMEAVLPECAISPALIEMEPRLPSEGAEGPVPRARDPADRVLSPRLSLPSGAGPHPRGRRRDGTAPYPGDRRGPRDPSGGRVPEMVLPVRRRADPVLRQARAV